MPGAPSRLASPQPERASCFQPKGSRVFSHPSPPASFQAPDFWGGLLSTDNHVVSSPGQGAATFAISWSSVFLPSGRLSSNRRPALCALLCRTRPDFASVNRLRVSVVTVDQQCLRRGVTATLVSTHIHGPGRKDRSAPPNLGFLIPGRWTVFKQIDLCL